MIRFGADRGEQNIAHTLEIAPLGIQVEFLETADQAGGELLEMDVIGRPRGFGARALRESGGRGRAGHSLRLSAQPVASARLRAPIFPHASLTWRRSTVRPGAHPGRPNNAVAASIS
jgi:hypothetical protein